MPITGHPPNTRVLEFRFVTSYKGLKAEGRGEGSHFFGNSLKKSRLIRTANSSSPTLDPISSFNAEDIFFPITIKSLPSTSNTPGHAPIVQRRCFGVISFISPSRIIRSIIGITLAKFCHFIYEFLLIYARPFYSIIPELASRQFGIFVTHHFFAFNISKHFIQFRSCKNFLPATLSSLSTIAELCCIVESVQVPN